MQTSTCRYRKSWSKHLIYLVISLSFFTCQNHEHNAEETPDAVRDLLIDRTFWKLSTTNDASRSSAYIHRFTITNTSHRYTYHQLKVRFDYYNNQHHKIDALTQIIERTIEPRTATKVDSVQTGPAKLAVTSATVTVISASAN